MIILPEWACKKEDYTASKDSDYFITKSLLGILRMLRQLRFQNKAGFNQYSVVGATLLTSLLVILIASSHKVAFLISVSAFLLIILCLLEASIIFRVLKHSITITFLSSIFLFPAFLFNQNTALLFIPIKTFLILLALTLLTTYYNWHSILDVMSKFHIPSVVVFVCDTTLRYLVLLGDTAQQILVALKIRSVGKNNNKHKSAAGVMGVLFQKSRQMSEEMYQAMCCRCFTGVYSSFHKQKNTLFDFIMLVIGVLYIYLYIVLEKVNL